MPTKTPHPAPERLLGLLGLGRRGGRLILGVDRVRRGLQAEEVCCVVVARDVSARAQDKVVRLAAAKGVPIIVGPDATVLGNRLGISAGVMAVGVVDRALARGLLIASPAASLMED